MQQVLIKVSGNTEIAILPAVKATLTTANSIVDSYSYTNNDQNGLFLKINFNPKSIQQILSNTNQALWGEERPLLLVWLDVTNNILTNNSNNAINTALQDNAKRLGLPIMLPAMDLQDLNDISTNDIEQLNLTAIKSASKRYNVNTILAGSLHQTPPDNWQSSWSLLINGKVIHWDINGNNLNQILTTVTNNIAGELAARLAVLSNSNVHNQIKILVTGITGLNQYADVIKYLQSLNTVTQVKLIDVGPNYITLQVTSLDGQEKLTNIINLDHKLIADQTATNNTNVDLTYHWATT